MAQVHAQQGALSWALRSIDLAHRALGRITADTPTPAWLRGMDTAAIHAHTAVVHLSVGRYSNALQSANEALDNTPPERVRDSAMTTLDLAEAYLGLHDVTRAAGHATTALKLTGQLRDGLHAGRVARRLADLDQRLTTHRESAAQQWVLDYHTAANPAAVSLGAGR
jgi:tetratricopeptide (TPR) repeat protein